MVTSAFLSSPVRGRAGKFLLPLWWPARRLLLVLPSASFLPHVCSPLAAESLDVRSPPCSCGLARDLRPLDLEKLNFRATLASHGHGHNAGLPASELSDPGALCCARRPVLWGREGGLLPTALLPAPSMRTSTPKAWVLLAPWPQARPPVPSYLLCRSLLIFLLSRRKDDSEVTNPDFLNSRENVVPHFSDRSVSHGQQPHPRPGPYSPVSGPLPWPGSVSSAPSWDGQVLQLQGL